jgi:RimJ/RimL family protein N-acetyltransferase
MIENKLSVREIKPADIDYIIQYWLDSDQDYLEGLGVDVKKLFKKEQITEMLLNQMEMPYEQKNAYCIIWEMDGKAIGHCNTNPSQFGVEANMHLHIWQPGNRMKGLGLSLLKMTIPYFFKNLQLKQLICEPYSLNPAPHKALEKLGFEFEKEYVTVPGSINFEQPVKRWVLSYDRYKKINLSYRD